MCGPRRGVASRDVGPGQLSSIQLTYLTTATSNLPPNIMAFSSIPQDILTPIFRLIDQSDRCSISRVSKVLRDVSRPTRFQDVQLHSKEAFGKLCNLVCEEEYAYCAKFVQEMTLDSDQTLSSPFPRLFPQLASLSVFCWMDIDLHRAFLASLGELSSLRRLALNASTLESTNPEEFSSLKLTELMISTKDSSALELCHNLLRGATQKSIATLAIHASSQSPAGQITDVFPNGIDSFPALRDLRLDGHFHSPKISRYSSLLPALSTFHCSAHRRGAALHDGNGGDWENLENLVVSYDSTNEVEDKIYEHAPNLKKVKLRELSVGSLHNVLLSIGRAGTNVCHLTSVSLDMILSHPKTIIKEDVLESALSSMKNLEHFTLTGYTSPVTRFQWFTNVDRLAKMLSTLRSLRSLRTNLAIDAMGFLPDKSDAVLPYVESKKEMYMEKTKSFFESCPSLQVVTWGFGAWSERWWHIPVKRFGACESGETDKFEIDEKIYISINTVFDESEFR
ncbi:hypothetical protein SCHPADRAFT_999371 [Schizopora paradoxa]|uniref:F-box domain-containing protein n=1 Tax=Schizopora paradoxa TaxID=27342 RepID=A0A0H2RFU8_9AGAM|nr:hypothetical protein SCHPADRAFT_999371 [Schizopora paradoxa]